MMYLITGKANAGKTTYANGLKSKLLAQGHSVYLLDGDQVRDKFNNENFSDKSRRNHLFLIAKFGSIAEAQGIIVIIACVAPKKKWRDMIRSHFIESKIVYIEGGFLWKNTSYEIPTDLELKP